mmetsp:Transcript_20487/g.28826  ORF Transcript_20487/g.28826 Transcript_20487/m.28826 type:complete len:91 (-) Transcript_20487:50-322(-)
MQLGMRVHNCKECILLLYSCPNDLEISALPKFKVDKENMSVVQVLQDADWWNRFEISAQCFYTSNLAWFYEARQEFNGEGATAYLSKILS